MRKALLIVVLGLVGLAGFTLYKRADSTPADPVGPQTAGNGGAGRGQPVGVGAAFARPPMTVEVATTSRANLAEHITIVGNLIGAATVDVAPKVSGRLQSVAVRLGDRVHQGQTIAQLEASEIHEQVKQAEASFDVARATVRQREADLKFADTNLERSRNLFSRQLLPRQTLDDADARYQASNAQLDLARAQFAQAKSRVEELRINLSNTRIASPVDGFVGKRELDPGAFVGPNSPVASVVDIHLVRLIVNVVEKDLRRIASGLSASVEVDAYPGETFQGRVARIAPVLDPATRTAQMEVEVPNADFRLKPGMYARVRFTVDTRNNALVIPRNALVDVEGKRGVFVATAGSTAQFRPVQTGLEDQNLVEITTGLAEGARVVTTGAAALRDGDKIVVPGTERRRRG